MISQEEIKMLDQDEGLVKAPWLAATAASSEPRLELDMREAAGEEAANTRLHYPLTLV